MKIIALAPQTKSNRLPALKLLPLALAGFIAIMTETMPAGLLPQIGLSLGIKESLAGQLITLYALGSVLAAIPVIAATVHWPRKRLLLFAVFGFLIFNAITAFSNNFILTLAARFLAGMAAGVLWGLLIGYAKRMVNPDQEGRAIAIVGAGQPVALALGVPLAAWLGKSFGWNGAFWMMSAVSFLLFIWVLIVLPDFQGIKEKKGKNVYQVFMLTGIRRLLLIMFIWILAHNIMYTYIAPFLSVFDRVNQIDLILMVFGIASISGLALIGILIDKWERFLTWISLLVFAAGAVLLCVAAGHPFLLYAGVSLWGLSFGGAPTLLQKSVADDAGEYADVAQSMFVTVFNLAVALGGISGAILLEYFGAISFPWAILILSVIIFLVILKRKR